MDSSNEKLLILENKSEICQATAERIMERLSFLSSTGFQLAKEDAKLYGDLLEGYNVGFEGMYIFEKHPSPHQHGMLETVTLVPLGEKSWGFIVDASVVNKNTDTELTIALLDEAEHARQKIDTIKKVGKLTSMTKEENEKNEINACLHSLDAYAQLEKIGLFYEEFNLLIELINLRRSKLELLQNDQSSIDRDKRLLVRDFLLRKGYTFD